MNEVEFYLEDLKSKFSKIDFNKYYLSYSGGKDSHLLLWFIKEYLKDNTITIVGVNTWFEHPEIAKRIIKNSDVVLRPTITPNELKTLYGLPVFSKMTDEMVSRYQKGSRSKSTMKYINGSLTNEYTMFKLSLKNRELLINDKLPKISNKCCYYFKKKPIKQYEKETGKHAIIGVRASDSILRRSKYKNCFQKNGNFTPLHDLTDDIQQKIYEHYNIEIPNVYKYITRTGCMGCPYGSKHGNTQKEIDLLTGSQKTMICSYFKESYEILGIKVDKEKLYYDKTRETRIKV